MRDTFGISEDHTAMTAPAGMRHSVRPRQFAEEAPAAKAPAAAKPAPAAKETPVAEAAPVAQPTQVAKAAPAPAQTAAAPSPRRVRPVAARTPRPTDLLEEKIEAAMEAAPQQADTAARGYVSDPSVPRWNDLPLVETGSRQTAQTAMPVADAEPDSVSVRAFDLLRTRLRQSTQEHGWTNIAVVSPTSGCGNTFTTVNLALSLSRISHSRTVLMDFNLRNPGVAKAFDVTPPGSMGDFLAGRTQIGDHMVRVSDTLTLGLNSLPEKNASDTLQAAETARTLERMRAALQPELVLYDMPPMLTHDDLSAFLPQLDGVLLVSDGTKTMGRDLLECERRLEGQVPLLGVVLNRARKDSVPHYA